MIELKPLQPEDLEKLKAEAIEDIKTYPESDMGIGWSGWYEGKVVGAGGLRLYWEGVAEGWLMLSKNVPDEIKVKLVLLFRSKLKELIEEHNLWRVQALVSSGFDRGISLIEALGFEYEGTMRKYTPDGNDMIMYSKVIER